MDKLALEDRIVRLGTMVNTRIGKDAMLAISDLPYDQLTEVRVFVEELQASIEADQHNLWTQITRTQFAIGSIPNDSA